MNDLQLVEFLRFGSSIPGNYWGCCAGDIIQCFKADPDAPASIQIANGDGGLPEKRGDEFVFCGPTNKDVFLQRLRIGTFSLKDLPNHFFLAVITEGQVKSSYGRKWLAILKECGFEFIRTINNSVWGGEKGINSKPQYEGDDRNYMFGLFRNIGDGNCTDPFTPPSEWSSLPDVKREAYTFIPVEERQARNLEYIEADIKVWDSIGPVKFLTEEEVKAAGAPVIYSGLRSENPQELKETRDARNAKKPKETSLRATAAGSPATPVAG